MAPIRARYRIRRGGLGVDICGLFQWVNFVFPRKEPDYRKNEGFSSVIRHATSSYVIRDGESIRHRGLPGFHVKSRNKVVSLWSSYGEWEIGQGEVY